jgi:ABC-2 type transport system permease protein
MSASMSASMIRRLVWKDWFLHRRAIILMVGGAILGVALTALPAQAAASIGVSLIMCVFIALTFYLPLTTVLEERIEKTLPFVMSLPVSPSEYTAAKILANLLLFLIPWSAALLGTILAVPSGSPILSSGVLPVLMVAFLGFFCFILGVALITESMGWTIVLIVSLLFAVGNVGVQLVPKIRGVDAILEGIAARGPAFAWALATEAAIILFIVVLTFLVQSRKRDFL